MEKSFARSVTTSFFCLLLIALSTSAFGLQKDGKQTNPVKDKRIDLLEKLEKGAAISSEDLPGTLGKSEADRDGREGYSRSPEFFIIPPFPPVIVFDHYDYDNDHDKPLISHEDVKEFHRELNKSLEEVRKGIESIRTSDEFARFQEEMRRWNESFRREMERMKEEWKNEEKEAKSNNHNHIHM
jgi:hypothetical protein